jgi:hypothetical protein
MECFISAFRAFRLTTLQFCQVTATQLICESAEQQQCQVSETIKRLHLRLGANGRALLRPPAAYACMHQFQVGYSSRVTHVTCSQHTPPATKLAADMHARVAPCKTASMPCKACSCQLAAVVCMHSAKLAPRQHTYWHAPRQHTYWHFPASGPVLSWLQPLSD